jgi:hypothetical protein
MKWRYRTKTSVCNKNININKHEEKCQCMMNKHREKLKIWEYRNGNWTQEQIETVKIITEGSDRIQELYDDKWTGMI